MSRRVVRGCRCAGPIPLPARFLPKCRRSRPDSVADWTPRSLHLSQTSQVHWPAYPIQLVGTEFPEGSAMPMPAAAIDLLRAGQSLLWFLLLISLLGCSHEPCRCEASLNERILPPLTIDIREEHRPVG